jgi:hypothetical protein
MYSLRFIKHVAEIDVSRHIYFCDMFYGMEGVAFTV